MKVKIKGKVKAISDLAFDAVDDDGSESLDSEELMGIMKEVAHSMRVTPPTENDIDFMLKELDANADGTVDKEEFLDLLMLVLDKMFESEVNYAKIQSKVNSPILSHRSIKKI